uniref:DRBM domain-containing protein n=1 Tax=Trichobilharzia regenti TaxID=157069 RepID=A0AA85IUW0_TRIRE|nr:unnamed protein product [Trichobilharzia regenti]
MEDQMWDNSMNEEETDHCPADSLPTADEENCVPEKLTVNSNVNVHDDIKPKEKHTTTKEKRFLINDMVEAVDFSLLPEGWLQLRHTSGLNVYLHRSSRVVTLSRPYSIGPGSVRYHRIPVSAIPCLAYRKAMGQNFRTVDSNKVSTEMADSCKESSDETKCNPVENSSENQPNGDTEKLQTSESVPLLVNKQDNTDNDVGETLTSNIDLSQSNNPYSSHCLEEVKHSDKEEGELSSADDEKDTSFEEEKVKKARWDDTSISVTNEMSISQDSLSEEKGEEVSNTSCPFTYKRSTHFGNKRRKRKYVVNRSGRKSASIISPTTTIQSESDVNKQGVSTGDEEFVAVKTQVFSVKDKEKESLLTPDEIREYCGRLFEIRVEDAIIQRNHERNILKDPTKEPEETQKPLLMMSEQAKVIRYQIPSSDGNTSKRQLKEGMINMTGKSYVCILHEYCQNVIRRPPTYQTKVLENEKNPYQMTVFINNNPYGTGTGQSKKCARLEAARKALEILIPDFQKIVGSNSHQSGPVTATDRDMELFDSISVSDPRLYELSVRMALPTPYNLLIECLSRSCVPESDLKSSMISQGRSKHFFTLQLREHVIKVRCKNKREGRHLAAQHLLSRLHPEVSTWSGLLRIYGPGSKPDKRNELETIQDAQVQQKSAVKASLIRLLRAKMSELADQQEKSGGNIHPKGKFFVSPYNLPVVAFHPDSEGDLYSSAPITSSVPSPLLPPPSD